MMAKKAIDLKQLFTVSEAAREIAGNDDIHNELQRLHEGLNVSHDSALPYVIKGDYSQPWKLLEPSNRGAALVPRLALDIARGMLREVDNPDEIHTWRKMIFTFTPARYDLMQIERSELARWLAYVDMDSEYQFDLGATAGIDIPVQQAAVADPPKWLEACRTTTGKKGNRGTLARWNPIGIATGLLTSRQIRVTDAKRTSYAVKLNVRFSGEESLRDFKEAWSMFYADYIAE